MKRYSIHSKVLGIIVVIGMICGFFIFVKKMAAWSAVRAINLDTHSLIYQAAYKQLMAHDPVARKSRFPKIGDILDFEGVIVSDTADDFFAIGGNGPDAPGKSKYSEHYYNPRNREGNRGEAPLSAKTWFMELVEAQLEGQYQLGCKGAAWAAHFLADVHVPYHVCGVPHMVAVERNQLTEDESGPRDVLKYNQVLAWEWGRNGDFTNNIGVFFSKSRLDSKRTEEMDWFDPWYFNGTVARTLQSSHITWERHAHRQFIQRKGYILQENFRYHPFWKNDWLDIDYPMLWYPQAYQTEVFTEKIASNTRENIEHYINNPIESIYESVWAVVTLWRASFSALKTDIRIRKSDNDENSVNVYGRFANTDESHTAFDVLARMTIIAPDGKRAVVNKRIADSLQPRRTAENGWPVKLLQKGVYTFKIEAICHYDNDLPDLQYAIAEEKHVSSASRTKRKYEDPGEDFSLEGEWELRGTPALRFRLKAGEYLGYSLDPIDSPTRVRINLSKKSNYLYHGSLLRFVYGTYRYQREGKWLRCEVIFTNPDTFTIKYTDISGEHVELGPFKRIR